MSNLSVVEMKETVSNFLAERAAEHEARNLLAHQQAVANQALRGGACGGRARGRGGRGGVPH